MAARRRNSAMGRKLSEVLVIFAVFLPSASALAQSPLELSAYKWTAGGQLAMPVVFERPSSWTWSLDLEPKVGFFALKNLEVALKLGLKARLASSEAHVIPQGVIWHVAGGGQYYFDTPILLHPYVGLMLGWGMEDTILFSSRILVDVPIGVLIAVSEHCAIDVGIPVNWEISMRSVFEKLTIKPAYLGVRVFI